MYTNKNKDIIQDNSTYTGLDGTKYPRNFPKTEITELSLVTESAQPTTNDVITGFHIDTNNTQVWDTRVKTAKELASDAKIKASLVVDKVLMMRSKRNMLLQQSDFSMLSDAPLTTAQKTAYNTYRQELRDLPTLYPDGLNVVWPTKPV